MRRSGFTMIELLVALSVGALALTAGSALAHVVIATAGRQHAAISRHSETMLGYLWLKDAFANATAGRPDDGPFQGSADVARFSTALPHARGWFEPAVVTVSLKDANVVLLWHGQSQVLVSGANSLAIDYLGEFGADSPWFTGWQSPSTVPLAVRLRIGRTQGTDTLVFRSLRSIR